MLFGKNLELVPGETITAITAKAEDGQLNIYALIVEFAAKPAGMDPLTQVAVKLPDNLPSGSTLLVSITLRGQTSNKVRIRTE